MSYFGANTPEQEILDVCKSLQEQQDIPSSQIILALAKVMQYYAEYGFDDTDFE
jgi:hypothetical protein